MTCHWQRGRGANESAHEATGHVSEGVVVRRVVELARVHQRVLQKLQTNLCGAHHPDRNDERRPPGKPQTSPLHHETDDEGEQRADGDMLRATQPMRPGLDEHGVRLRSDRDAQGDRVEHLSRFTVT
jgi:hypothetical protein